MCYNNSIDENWTKNIMMKKEEIFFVRFFRGMIFTVARFGFFLAFRTKVHYTNGNGRKSRYKGPCIFICNHTHLFDGILLTILLQYNSVHALVAKDWFERKNLNWILKQGRCFPIDRYKRDFSWLHSSLKAFKHGESILIFPEGGISKTGTMKPFKSGFILLAQKSGVPIVPVAVLNEYRMFGKRQHIVVDEPHIMDIPDKNRHNSVYMEEKSEFFRNRIEALIKIDHK